MKVKICSRDAILSLIENEELDGFAIISFYDPPSRRSGDYGPIDFKGVCENVFMIEELDLDPSALKKFGLTFEKYLSCANELAKFIYRVREMGLNIICQCEYGQSRSAGCAAAILEHFGKRGIKVFADYRYYPNQMIFNKVLRALDEYKEALCN
ncbi:MAG: hypothetical protein IKA43_00065 [Clostridia bacterium]|nr:hypothetical protein [Clostridia bacterium]